MHVLLDVPNKTRFTRPNSYPVEQTWNVPNIAQWVQEGKDGGDKSPQEEKTIFGTDFCLHPSLLIESIVLLTFWAPQGRTGFNVAHTFSLPWTHFTFF